MFEIIIVRAIGYLVSFGLMLGIAMIAFKFLGVRKGQKIKTFAYLLIVPLIDMFFSLNIFKNINLLVFVLLTIIACLVPLFLNKIEDGIEKNILLASVSQQLLMGVYAERMMNILDLNTLSILEDWLGKSGMMILFYTGGTIFVLLIFALKKLIMPPAN